MQRGDARTPGVKSAAPPPSDSHLVTSNNIPSPPGTDLFRPDVTVATIVPRNGRLLLVEERALGELVLNQPAGHLEAGESLIEAAARETLEESGWEVAITHLVGVYRWCVQGDERQHEAAAGRATPVAGPTFLRFAFAAEPVRHHPERPLDRGIERALWLTPAELRAVENRLRSPLVLAVVDDWLAGARLPLSALRDIK